MTHNMVLNKDEVFRNISEGKGFSNNLWNPSSNVAQPLVNGERKFKRIFIKNNVHDPQYGIE